MVNRRDIIKSLSLLLLPSLGGATVVDLVRDQARPKTLRWKGILQLSQPTSWDDFCDNLSQKVDVEFLDDLKNSLLASGAVLKMETRFTGDKVEWTYYFRDQSDYEDWLNKTSKSPVRNDFDFSNYKMTLTEINRSEIDFNAPEFENTQMS